MWVMSKSFSSSGTRSLWELLNPNIKSLLGCTLTPFQKKHRVSQDMIAWGLLFEIKRDSCTSMKFAVFQVWFLSLYDNRQMFDRYSLETLQGWLSKQFKIYWSSMEFSASFGWAWYFWIMFQLVFCHLWWLMKSIFIAWGYLVSLVDFVILVH